VNNFNFRLVSVGQHGIFRLIQGFPKELLWYFGIDKLAIEDEERGESEGGGMKF